MRKDMQIAFRLAKKRDEKIKEGMDYLDALKYSLNRWDAGITLGFKNKNH